MLDFARRFHFGDPASEVLRAQPIFSLALGRVI
jgi:hypothetical protein